VPPASISAGQVPGTVRGKAVNPYERYISERLVHAPPDQRLSVSQVWDDALMWSRKAKPDPPLKRLQLTVEMRKAGFRQEKRQVRKIRGKYWVGLAFRQGAVTSR
jgi:hypothetical protein